VRGNKVLDFCDFMIITSVSQKSAYNQFGMKSQVLAMESDHQRVDGRGKGQDWAYCCSEMRRELFPMTLGLQEVRMKMAGPER